MSWVLSNDGFLALHSAAGLVNKPHGDDTNSSCTQQLPIRHDQKRNHDLHEPRDEQRDYVSLVKHSLVRNPKQSTRHSSHINTTQSDQMTAIIARLPLHDLSMSAMQSGSRRLSARLQEKDVTHSQTDGESQLTGASRSKKRKNDYDEMEDGFAFSRVKKQKKPRQSIGNSNTNTDTVPTMKAPSESRQKAMPIVQEEPLQELQADEQTVQKKERRKKMSFSTPVKPAPAARRSKRLSSEASQPDAKKPPDAVRPQPAQDAATPKRVESHSKHDRNTEPTKPALVESSELQKPASPSATRSTEENGEQHSSTKISLPFADTPVIRRNKAMREGRGSKGERRSSLGLRGRRASSLIETGNSSALPHQKVDSREFYKHIESDMIEPRRMKQLLTWCGTRAMHSKAKGVDAKDSGPRSAARIVEEDILRDIVNKSEVSDWFSREDAPAPDVILPERPNPKNEQNLEKVKELEQQIRRLRLEKETLLSVSKAPEMKLLNHKPSLQQLGSLSETSLSEEDTAILDELQSSTDIAQDTLQRLTALTTTLEPTIDTFADGVHKIAQYRMAADDVASRVLSICAARISEREREGRQKALGVEVDRSLARDLGNVLRSLSRAVR